MEKLQTVFATKILDRFFYYSNQRKANTSRMSLHRYPKGLLCLSIVQGFESDDQAMSAQQQQQATKRVRGTPIGQTPSCQKRKGKKCPCVEVLVRQQANGVPSQTMSSDVLVRPWANGGPSETMSSEVVVWAWPNCLVAWMHLKFTVCWTVPLPTSVSVSGLGWSCVACCGDGDGVRVKEGFSASPASPTPTPQEFLQLGIWGVVWSPPCKTHPPE